MSSCLPVYCSRGHMQEFPWPSQWHVTCSCLFTLLTSPAVFTFIQRHCNKNHTIDIYFMYGGIYSILDQVLVNAMVLLLFYCCIPCTGGWKWTWKPCVLVSNANKPTINTHTITKIREVLAYGPLATNRLREAEILYSGGYEKQY